MKKFYEEPRLQEICLETEEELLASVIPGSGTPGTEIGDGEVPLW